MAKQAINRSSSAESRLLALATALARSNSRLEMYKLVATHIQLYSGAELASICLIDPLNPTIFEAVALTGSDDSISGGIRMPLGYTLVGQVIGSRQPRFWDLAGSNEADTRSLVSEGVTAAFLAPIRCGEASFGTFNIGYLNTPVTDTSFQEVLVGLAHLLGCQLARLDVLNGLRHETDDQQRHAAKLEKLHGLESLLTDASSLEAIIDILSVTLPELLNAQHISFTKDDPDPSQSTTYEIYGTQNYQVDAALPIGEQIFRRQIATSEPLHAPEDSGVSESNHLVRSATRLVSSIDLPVFVHGTPVGTLSVGAPIVAGFSADDQRLLAAVASFMGRALQRIVTHQELVFMAKHDQLTGLIHNRLFQSELDTAVRAASSLQSPDNSDHPQAALCLIDIDHFKLINDADGHRAGDKLLRDIAARIRRSVGVDDTPSRLGADFVVLLRSRSPRHHEQVCQEIIKAVSTMPFISNGRVFRASVSVGLAFLTETTVSGTAALASAEAACHESKRLGGNYVSIESSSDTEQAARRTAATWTSRLHHAIETDEFVLYAQPIHPISAAGSQAVEVLVRLPDEDGSIIPPDRFIPIAEKYGLISSLDAWVTENALRSMRTALDIEATGAEAKAPELIFINLSPNSIATKGFFERLQAIITRSRVPADRIVFEITETGSMHNFEATLDFVNRMRMLGPQIALDDFGVGLSSLGYLRQLNIDFLKIDGSLVHDVGNDPVKTTMIGAIKAMADALEVKTIAEHIDSDLELSTLRKLGIDHVQGYYVGHPAPIERALRIAPSDRIYQASASPAPSSQAAKTDH